MASSPEVEKLARMAKNCTKVSATTLAPRVKVLDQSAGEVARPALTHAAFFACLRENSAVSLLAK